jgi:hypothetical protein
MNRLSLPVFGLCLGLIGLTPIAASPDTNQRQASASPDDNCPRARKPLIRPLSEPVPMRKRDKCRARRILM